MGYNYNRWRVGSDQGQGIEKRKRRKRKRRRRKRSKRRGKRRETIIMKVSMRPNSTANAAEVTKDANGHRSNNTALYHTRHREESTMTKCPLKGRTSVAAGVNNSLSALPPGLAPAVDIQRVNFHLFRVPSCIFPSGEAGASARYGTIRQDGS